MQYEQVNRFRLTPEEYRRLERAIIPITLKLSDGQQIPCELTVASAEAVTIDRTTTGNGSMRQNRTGARRGGQQLAQPNRQGKFKCDVAGCTAEPYDTRRSLGVHKVKAHNIHGRFWSRNQRQLNKTRSSGKRKAR